MLFINVMILAVFVAGHTELLVAFVNRTHGLRLPDQLLRHIRHLHDLLIPAFPLILLWCVGLSGPAVLTGGSWANLSSFWSGYLSICGLGAASLLWAAIGRRWKRIPANQLSNHSQLVDVAKTLGFRPVGQGPYQFLTKIPGNELFQIQVSEKAYEFANLPVEWNGLTIMHLTDWHFIGTIDRPFFEEASRLSREMQPDLIVFTGDLLDRATLVEWLPTTLGTMQARLGCYFILGNHDWYLQPNEIRTALCELGWHDVGGHVTTIDHNGQPLAIGGSEVPWMGEHPDFSVAPQNAFRLLLSHTPDNINWARAQGVDLMLSGHNHGGQVVLPMIGPVYSPSVYGCKYAGGSYYEDPTLLYVSRGLSAKHPLRLGCPPELTKLVLNRKQ